MSALGLVQKRCDRLMGECKRMEDGLQTTQCVNGCAIGRELTEQAGAESKEISTGQSGSLARSAEEPPFKGAARGAPAGELALFASRRLCKTCAHCSKGVTQSLDYAQCVHPLLPVNLVTGQRRFPCIIARGYNELCGAMGLKWEYRKS